MSFGEILGLIAGAITTGSFVPQVIRVYKIRSAHEISLGFILAFIAGDLIWLIYGIYFQLFPVIFWNVLAIILAIILLVGKIRYGKHLDKPERQQTPQDAQNREHQKANQAVATKSQR